jgi:hypothetical protein
MYKRLASYCIENAVHIYVYPTHTHARTYAQICVREYMHTAMCVKVVQ